MQKSMIAAAMAAMFALPIAAGAQGIVGGAAAGVEDGTRAAGPVGGIVGGAVGAVVGGIDGLFGVDQRPRFRDYAVRRHHASYAYDREVVIGTVLPEQGVTYYEVPAEYGVRAFRYTIVNDRPVLVDPTSRRIVDVIE